MLVFTICERKNFFGNFNEAGTSDKFAKLVKEEIDMFSFGWGYRQLYVHFNESVITGMFLFKRYIIRRAISLETKTYFITERRKAKHSS